MKYAYLLQHSYEFEYEGETFDEIKVIGIFSSKETAARVIDEYKLLPGFRDYPLDCFHISKYEIDKRWWNEGFGFKE